MRPVQIHLSNAEGRVEPEAEVPGAVLARKLSYADPSLKKLETELSRDGRRALDRIRLDEARRAVGKKARFGGSSEHADRTERKIHREDHTVHLYDERQRTFPIGLLDDVREILRAEGIETEVLDERRRPEPTMAFELTGKWREALETRDYQARAVLETDHSPRRLHAWGTSSGKTLAIAGIIARRKVRTLVITATRALLHQMAEDLREYLEESPTLFYGEEKELSPLTVALADSVYYHVDEIAAAGFEMVIIDEARLSGARKYVIPEKRISAYHVYGFDGTAWREGGDDLVLTAIYGRERPEVSTPFLREQGYIAEVKIHFEEVRHKVPASLSWDEKVKRAIVRGKARNEAVIQRVRHHLAASRSVLVLIEQIEHSERLSRRLDQAGIHHRVTTGLTRDRDLVLFKDQFTSGQVPVMVTNLLDFGFNYRELGATINAAGLKGEIGVWQKIGRSERKDDEGREKHYDDFLDRGDPLLFEWSRARMLALEAKGYRVLALERLRKEEAEEAERKKEEMQKLEKCFKAEEKSREEGILQDAFNRKALKDTDRTEVGAKELDGVL